MSFLSLSLSLPLFSFLSQTFSECVRQHASVRVVYSHTLDRQHPPHAPSAYACHVHPCRSAFRRGRDEHIRRAWNECHSMHPTSLRLETRKPRLHQRNSRRVSFLELLRGHPRAPHKRTHVLHYHYYTHPQDLLLLIAIAETLDRNPNDGQGKLELWLASLTKLGHRERSS